MRVVSLFFLGLIACGGPLGVPVEGGADTGLPAPASRHGSIAGVVSDGAGQALAGVRLVTTPRGQEAESDADGAFLIEWLPPAEYDLVAALEGYEVLEGGPVAVQAGQQATVELQLAAAQPTSLVTITVLGPEGAPLAGAAVTASSGWAGSTDAAGVVSIEGLAGEALSFAVEAADGDLWSRNLEAQAVEAAGGLQWDTQLAGRAPDGAGWTGSAMCVYCHADRVAEHAGTAHARAHVEEPSDALLEACAGGVSVELGSADAWLWLDGEDCAVTLEASDGERRSFGFASFLGDPERAAVPTVWVAEQRFPLPFSWVAAVQERGTYPDSQAGLHPFETHRWFDEAGTFSGDAPDPASSAEASCLPCHSTAYTLERQKDGGAELSWASATMEYAGVSCEACHGPAGGHTSSASAATITSPAKLDPARADEACGQCHGRGRGLVSGLPHPHAEPERFVPGATLRDFVEDAGERWPSGAAAVSRMQLDEHRDALHAQRGLRCIDCHDAHDDEASRALLRVESRDNGLCEACHMGLGFDHSEEVALTHMAHGVYQPDGNQEGGRCTGCHMVPTASDGAWSSASGAGRCSSHGFVALSPASTLALFDSAGASELEPGAFPPHACSDCHAWNAWFFEGYGTDFWGPHGDPRLASTHEAFLASWEELYP